MIYTHRNGETEPPEVGPKDFTRYWFQGEADQEDWEQRSEKMIVITGQRTEQIEGLVIVTLLFDMKKAILNGDMGRDHPVMLTEIESAGYDLSKCRGRWWGPVHCPLVVGGVEL